jgi:hypothetical protein
VIIENSYPAFLEWAIPTSDWITPEWSNPLVSWQQGRCAICGTRGEPLVEDHDHVTGLIRGLICRSCNNRERSSTHPAFAMWRSGCTPATLLGYKEVYIDPFTGLAPQTRGN